MKLFTVIKSRIRRYNPIISLSMGFVSFMWCQEYNAACQQPHEFYGKPAVHTRSNLYQFFILIIKMKWYKIYWDRGCWRFQIKCLYEFGIKLDISSSTHLSIWDMISYMHNKWLNWVIYLKYCSDLKSTFLSGNMGEQLTLNCQLSS